jgi:hypothetical protein
MKAIILREHGSPEKFEEIDLPIRPPKSRRGAGADQGWID